MFEKSNIILVCPLNWGLGHATRCIPCIRALLAAGKKVIVGADGYPLKLLQEEFPGLVFVDFPSYKIRYSRGSSQVFAMMRSLPSVVYGIFREHRRVKKIISDHQVDTVLSDNRFGLWNKGVTSVYMTHQLMIKMPRKLKWLEKTMWRMHRFFIHKYDICMIPDVEENGGYSGDLSHKFKLPRNGRFIGVLSRFDAKGTENIPEQSYDVLVILSGVEPQRSMLEQQLTEALSKKNYKSLLVQGLPGNDRTLQSGSVTVVPSLPSKQMKAYLTHTPVVICRSGYSSIMDLVTLNRRAILIPTPGQTEQEYLASYLEGKGLFECVKQGEIKI